MIKNLTILLLIFLYNVNANALTVKCKSMFRTEIIHYNIYDLTIGGKWSPEYTKTYIYWTEIKKISGEGSLTKAIAVYHQLDRNSGHLQQGFSFENYLEHHLKKNRTNASIDYYLDGNCEKIKDLKIGNN